MHDRPVVLDEGVSQHHRAPLGQDPQDAEQQGGLRTLRPGLDPSSHLARRIFRQTQGLLQNHVSGFELTRASGASRIQASSRMPRNRA